MKTVFVAPSIGVTLLFYPAGLTPTKEGRQPGRTNHPLLIAAPHKLCFLLQLLIYSQKQCVDVLFNYIKDMKKFAVLQKIGKFNARVVREFDNEGDAIDFARLMESSEDSSCIKYYVAGCGGIFSASTALAG